MTAETASTLTSLPLRISQWAAEQPDRPAIIFAPDDAPHQTLSWGAMDALTNQIARLLAQHGVDENGRVVIGLRNCTEHLLASVATWKLGAMAIPIRNATPPHERDQILDLAEPTIAVTDWGDISYPTLTPRALLEVDGFSAEPLPDITPNPGKAMASGGSTGRPKLIVDTGPLAWETDLVLFPVMKMNPGIVQLISGSLYHAAPFAWMYLGLFQGQTMVLTPRFNPAQVVELIEQYKVEYAYMAPIMMSRVAKLPDIAARDLSSLDCLIHMAAPCPPWLKRAWIDLVGPENLLEVYAATEAGIVTGIWGADWLTHPNSVGPAMPNYALKILDASGKELPRGEIGEIYITRTDQEFNFNYVGSTMAPKVNEYATIGDLGWMDEDDYLYIADRRVDMIITGGANVFPAEVEAALTEHSSVADVAVIGLPDDEWGKRVHAVVQPLDQDEPPSTEVLDAHCRERLMAYKLPKSYEFIEQLPRTSAGKIRRSAMIEERAGDSG